MRTHLPEMTCGFFIQLVFCQKKNTMWFIGVEVEQETSEPAPKKILDPPLQVMTGYGIHEMKYMKGQEDLSNKCLKRTLI